MDLMRRRREMMKMKPYWDYIWEPDGTAEGKNVITTKRILKYYPNLAVGDTFKVTIEISANAKGTGFIADWDVSRFTVNGIEREKTMESGVNTYMFTVTYMKIAPDYYGMNISGFYSHPDGYASWRSCAANYIKIRVEVL